MASASWLARLFLFSATPNSPLPVTEVFILWALPKKAGNGGTLWAESLVFGQTEGGVFSGQNKEPKSASL